MDDVFLAGGDGRLYAGDGRTRKDPSRKYGSGGVLDGKPCVFSVTANAPAEAFDDEDEPFFEGLSVSELLTPVHLACQFNAMKPLETFCAHDVHKNPNIDADFVKFDMHLMAIVKNNFT
jgi:modulator of drug activity B